MLLVMVMSIPLFRLEVPKSMILDDFCGGFQGQAALCRPEPLAERFIGNEPAPVSIGPQLLQDIFQHSPQPGVLQFPGMTPQMKYSTGV